jgi:hypothetical protein
MSQAREALYSLFAMRGGWVEPKAFADDVLDALYVPTAEEEVGQTRQSTISAAPHSVPPFDAFVADVLLAITDGETDNIANFPTGTQDRLETLYEEMCNAR